MCAVVCVCVCGLGSGRRLHCGFVDNCESHPPYYTVPREAAKCLFNHFSLQMIYEQRNRRHALRCDSVYLRLERYLGAG